ncbi:MAG: DNA polymerase III subunit delta' [Desulfurobacteriaceae bacterium]
MVFETVVGHTKQILRIKDLISKNLFPSSSLFVGPYGVGKKLIAFETLKEITGSPLNVKVVGEDKPPAIDEIREISSWLFTKPQDGKGKGVIIDNADQMRSEAANALLKTLEEPPSYGFLILISKNEGAILPTLRSRCKIFRFGRLTDSDLERIFERLEIPVDKRVIKLAGGSIGLALQIVNSPIPDLVKEFLELMKLNNKTLKIVSFAQNFSKLSRDEALLFLDALENLLSQKDTILKWFEAIKRGREFLNSYAKPQSVVEWMLLEVLLKTERETF